MLAALPATASASTAKVVIGDTCGADLACSKYGGGQPSPIVTYVASPGEANRLTVTRDGRALILADPAAAVAAEAPCRVLDAHTASCDGGKPTPLGADSVSVQLGDGDDAVTIAPGVRIVTSLFGQAGDDVLAGGDVDAVFDGGPGADRVDGRSARDVLSFTGRREGVTVDLAAGRTSDGDVLTGIETVWGGDGPDRLLGGRGADVITGGPGADVLRGRGGNDVLSGDVGADVVDGGAGNDTLSGDPVQGDGYYTPIIRLSRDVLRGGSGRDVILARDGRRDRVACGSGRDLAHIDKKDRVRACEKLRLRRYTSRR